MSFSDIAQAKGILDSLPRAVIVHRLGRPLYANPAALALLGLATLADFLARPRIGTFVAPEDPVGDEERFNAILRGKIVPTQNQVTILTPQGERLHLEVIRSSIVWGPDEATLLTLYDITEARHTQEKLNRSEALLHTVFDTLPIWLWVKDMAGHYLMVNRKMVEETRFPAHQLGSVTLSDLKLPAGDVAEFIAEDERIIASGKETRSERETRVPGGAPVYLSILKQPLMDATGATTGLVGMAVDVTPLRGMQQKLEESRRLLMAVFDNIPLSILVKDLDGRHLMANRATGTLLGVPPESLIGKRGEEVLSQSGIHDPQRGLVSATDAQALSGKVVELEMDRQFASGRKRYRVIKVPLFNAEQKVSMVVSIAEDITLRRDAEDAVRASEERYRLLVDGSLQGIAVFSLRDQRALYVNKAMLALTGDPQPGEYIGKVRFFDRMGDAQARRLKAAAERLAAGELDHIRDEMPVLRADGSSYWAEFMAHRVQWESEPALQFIVLDVTARKQAEEALKDRQALLTTENEYFRRDISRRRNRTHDSIVAESEAMRHVLEEAEMVARARVPVLIEGETGVGKEVVAEFIHKRSDRADHVLSVVNCGALSENLMDAELFGYEKGAFTGAAEARAGLIEIADHGTLFLDEIGDLTAGGQVRLLRFLERGLVRRVGATREKKVDVRVLAATHKTLKKQVEAGTFREDLYHRLLVIRIEVPPLRDRIEDILPLAGRLVEQACREAHIPLASISKEARLAMTRYAWPGNVRELSHAVQRAVFAVQMDGSDSILPRHLDLSATESAADAPQQLKDFLQQAETGHIREVLRRFEGNRRKAAEALGISERQLYRLLS